MHKGMCTYITQVSTVASSRYVKEFCEDSEMSNQSVVNTIILYQFEILYLFAIQDSSTKVQQNLGMDKYLFEK